MLRPITTEKAVKLIDLDNTLMFETELGNRKEQIKSEIESLFKVKVDKIRTLIHANKKVCFVKLNKANPAIDLATKLGVI
jgi:ribosomal protein L23